VPFSVLPLQGSAHDAVLSVRVRSVEGLPGSNLPRLTIGLRFGPLVAGLRVDKSKEVSVKCQMELVRGHDGKWVPEASGGGAARVTLPPSLFSQSGQGIVCRIKLTTPGIVTANILAASMPVPVPIEPGPVSLASARQGQGQAQPVAAVMISISRVFSAEAQAAMARVLIQRVIEQLRDPSGPPNGVPAVLDALRPSRGWLPSSDVLQALNTTDGQRRNALRLAVDGRHWECVQALVEAWCNPRELAEDLRSPLTAALERGAAEPGALLAMDRSLGPEARRVAGDFAALLAELRAARGGCQVEVAKRWEALAKEVAVHFQPPGGARPAPDRPISGAAAGDGPQPWSCDVCVLMLEHCPTGRARRTLLCAEGACAALWRASLCQNLPGLARKLAVWIGLSFNGTMTEENGGPLTRRRLLDIQLGGAGGGGSDTVLARVLEKGTRDERWVRVARAMVQLGASPNSAAPGGQSPLLFTLEQADQGRTGFNELLQSFLHKLGDDVDQWDQPTILIEDRCTECPICLEPLWTSTPTAFVNYIVEGGRERQHVICSHFFCFDCASQQYMKQQSQRVDEYHCPVCRGPAKDMMPLPDILINPRLWFQFFDLRGQGRLDKSTLALALEAILPLDTENQHGDDHGWAGWGKTKGDYIEEHEFFCQGGLLEWVRAHQHELSKAKARGMAPPIEEPERWFTHWDRARRGRLQRGEVLRALCEAVRISSLETKKIQQVRAGVQGVWDRHVRGDFLTRERFLKCNLAPEFARVVGELEGGGHVP